ncbi:MAG: endolytic transglycosylase MltG [Bacteroidales bacterium]
MTKRVKILLLSVLVVVVLAAVLLISSVMQPGITPKGKRAVLMIPSGARYGQVLDSVYLNFEVRNRKLFELIAQKKGYPAKVKPGRYQFDNGTSYLKFINILRGGFQTPVRVTFNNVRTIYQLAGKIGKYLESDSSAIAAFLEDPANYRTNGFSRENVILAFIPNTYIVYWNTSPAAFFEKMSKEYNRFWNSERSQKADALKLTRIEVGILASMVDDETLKADEKPRIAGVYLNRLRRGMPLQSCPTIKFALNDFTITRILYKYLQVDSPYNTYKHTGLPPGPVGCPTTESIDAVLNAEKTDYLFFAAKADFSGYHNFSRTLKEHNKYADEYQKELDRRKIFR